MIRFLYASTKDADMRYRLRMHIGDPVFLLDGGEERTVFLDRREIGMFAEENRDPLLHATPLEPFIDTARKQDKEGSVRGKIAWNILESAGLLKTTIHVGASFPLDMADDLRSQGVTLVVEKELYPERRVKSSEEIEAIQSALERTKKAFEWIEEVLRASVIEGEIVVYRKEPLTSEFLRKVVERMFFDEGLLCTEGSIIASGSQTAMPHHYGKGVIFAHKPIIVDLFPQDKETGYFADMTRTYVKGVASLECKRMWSAVNTAREAASATLREGVSTKHVHETASRVFEERGFKTGEEGFIHATGHGVGLEIHEHPRLGKNDEKLEVGMVVTIEPGLYYKAEGGVRIEDMVLVAPQGPQNLTGHPVFLEIE